MNFAKIINFNGMPCVELSVDDYTALIAYEIGSNVIRLRNTKSSVDVFRFNDSISPEELLKSAEVWGLPLLYLPNRFADGILKTSDATYHLPVNEGEPYNNHIHGFIHKRVHSIVEYDCDENKSWLKTQYLYDENDDFFQYLPVKFNVEYTFTLSNKGLDVNIKFTNLSEKVLPMVLASHTAIQAPFVDEGKLPDIRISVPVLQKCELNERCLPTERILDLTPWDAEYNNGTKVPVLQNIDNDMYLADKLFVEDKDFYGMIAEDIAKKVKIFYEVSNEYRFWIIWNDKGFNGYFCPEPMTAMINSPNLNMPNYISGYKEIIPNNTFETKQRFFVKKY